MAGSSSEPTAAYLAGNLGRFELTVASYGGDAPDAGHDWLDVRVEWRGAAMHVLLEGAILDARELESWSEGVVELASGTSGEARRFGFIEPNLSMTCQRSDRLGHFSIRLAIHGEPAMTGEHFEVEFVVDQSDLRRFGEDLRRWSRAFPPR